MAADLVMLGIGPPVPQDRRHGVSTAVLTAWYLDATLYAVAPGCELPVSGVVVLADGQVHTPTLRAAACCTAPGGRLCLALPRHTQPADDQVAVHGSARDIVSRACGQTFAAQLDDLVLERVDIGDDMLAGVLKLADDRQAQFIAVSMRGVPGPVRAFLPNLADSLLLGAQCSVLVLPDELAVSTREPFPG
jgi:nucleotide-binding universal stress UspA family protein